MGVPTRDDRAQHHHLLAIYLNDHLLGASAGRALCRRAARSQPVRSNELHELADEISADVESLLSIMRELDVRPKVSRAVAGRVGELIGRVKLNGHLISRSPLSDLVELEALTLGVLGKRSLWRSLRQLDGPRRVDSDRLATLAQRADDQAARLEDMRRDAAGSALAGRAVAVS